MEKETIMTINCWSDLGLQLESLAVPSSRHAHTINEIGSQLWLFGGMGLDFIGSSSGKNRGQKRRQLNDLYVLNLKPVSISMDNAINKRINSTSTCRSFISNNGFTITYLWGSKWK